MRRRLAPPAPPGPAPALTYPVNIQHDKRPLTNRRPAGPDGRRLNQCHKRHIVYRTERHCSTNTNTPAVGDTLGKSWLCGSGEQPVKRLLLKKTEKKTVLRFDFHWPSFSFLIPPVVLKDCSGAVNCGSGFSSGSPAQVLAVIL